MSDAPNPFQSPQASGGFTPIDVGAGTLRPVLPYATARPRAVWAITLVAIVMTVDLVGAASTLSQIGLLENVRAGRMPSQAEAEANDQRQITIGMGQLAAALVSAVTFLMWFHRTHRNLPALGAGRLQYSPGWAVGSFFVPILNLFRPFQIMKEVWHGSDPAAVHQRSSVMRARGGALVGWWWTFWIGLNIVSRFAFSMARSAESVDSMVSASWAGAVSDLLTVPAAMVTMLMIHTITNHQEARHRLLSPMPAASRFA